MRNTSYIFNWEDGVSEKENKLNGGGATRPYKQRT